MVTTDRKDLIIRHISWFVFFVHLVLFLGINIMMIVANFLNSPSFPWFIIPLASWGLILFMHFLITFFLVSDSAKNWREGQYHTLKDYKNEFGLSDEVLQKKVTARLFAWMFFYVHLATFLGANIIMILINYYVAKAITWSLISLSAWLIWILVHFVWTYVLFSDRKKMNQWRLKKLKRGLKNYDPKTYREANIRFLAWSAFNLHFFIFFLTNIALVVIDLMLNPTSQRWFLYPLIAWGFFLLGHYMITYFILSEKYSKK